MSSWCLGALHGWTWTKNYLVVAFLWRLAFTKWSSSTACVTLCYIMLPMATFDPVYVPRHRARCFKIHFTNQLCSLNDTHYDALMPWCTHFATRLRPSLAIFTPLLWFIHQQTKVNQSHCYDTLRYITQAYDTELLCLVRLSSRVNRFEFCLFRRIFQL